MTDDKQKLQKIYKRKLNTVFFVYIFPRASVTAVLQNTFKAICSHMSSKYARFTHSIENAIQSRVVSVSSMCI